MKYTTLTIGLFLFVFLPLTAQEIDWWTSFGAGSSETVTKVTTDTKGNIVVLGTHDEIFDIGNNTLVIEREQEFFLAKFDRSGTPLWVRTFTGVGLDQGADIAIDDQDIIYLAAYFDNKVRINDEVIFAEGGMDGLIMQITPAGFNGWIKNIGGTETQRTLGITVDASHVYAVGDFENFGKIDDIIIESVGGRDMWIAKIEKTEARLQWLKRFGGSGDERLNSIVKDFRGDLYACGAFSGSFQLGTQTLNAVNGSDALITKLTDQGEPIWVKEIKGDYEQNEALNLEVDEVANIYVSGIFGNTVNLAENINLTAGPDSDGFLLSYNANGGLRWSHRIQTQGPGRLNGLQIRNNRLYVAGTAENGTLFDQENITNAEGAYAFLAGFALDGRLQRLGLFDGPGKNEGIDLTGENETISLVGTFEQTLDFGGETATSVGGTDIFIANIDATTLITDVEEQPLEAALELQVDPAVKSLTVLFPHSSDDANNGYLQIWDAQGRLLQMKKANRQTLFDLSNVSSGVYFVQWRNGGRQLSKAFVLY